MIQKLKVPLSKLVPNEDNPRYIRETEFDELYQSILEFPEMAEVKEIVVNKDYLILGGNMRYHAMNKAGWTEANVVIVDWSEEKQREFIIKDNVHKGTWDYETLVEKWDTIDAKNWGVDMSKWEIDNSVERQQAEDSGEPEVNEVTCPYCGHDNPRYEDVSN